MRTSKVFACACAAFLATSLDSTAAEPQLNVRQLTRGPKHHFFGYIGQSQTIPWNASGRYIVGLQTDFHDRMPKPDEAAEVILLDTHKNHEIRAVERTRAWNFQQGTMFYWNPLHPETQFFFNDRDTATNRVFCVLYDLASGKRIAEYKYDDAALGNGGVRQQGGLFAALNYGRMARLRPVTGYPGAFDWTAASRDPHPENDGVFLVDAATKEKRLLVSFSKAFNSLKSRHPEAVAKELFINHTLWSRDGQRLFFFVRGDFEIAGRLDVPFVVDADGGNLRMLDIHPGGHPEWGAGHELFVSHDGRHKRYDVDKQQFAATVGDERSLPDPTGDKSLSPAGDWLVNGFRQGSVNRYVLFRLSDGLSLRSGGYDQRTWTKGELRIDPAPCWNRDGTRVLFPSLDADGQTRQMFEIELVTQ